MRKIIIILFLYVLRINIYGQLSFSKNDFEIAPRNYDAETKRIEILAEKYRTNKAHVDKLIDWVFDLKTQSNDSIFNAEMDNYYEILRGFYSLRLEQMDYRINEVELDIKYAISEYNTRIKEQNNPKVYYDEGLKCFKDGNYSKAIKAFNKAIELSPSYSYYYLIRAKAYYNLGNYSASITDLDTFIYMEPSNEKAFKLRGWNKIGEKDFMGAILDFNKYIELSPNSAFAYYSRGSAKSELKDFYGSKKDYDKAILLDPTFPLAYNNIAWDLFNQNKYQEALPFINKAIELDEKSVTILDTRFEIYFAIKDYTKCLKDCQTAIELNPKYANAYFIMGRAYYNIGLKEKACISWSNAGENGKIEAYDYISKCCNN